MGTDIIEKQGDTPHVLKNMQEYLNNPKTIKELYVALTTMPREEFYDLHPEELREVHGMFRTLDSLPGHDHERDRMHYEIHKMLSLKENVEEICASLYHALQEYPVERYFSEGEKEKYAVFQQQMKSVFKNIMQYLEKYKKQITIEGVYTLQESNESPVRRLDLLKRIEGGQLAKIITYILQNHIYIGTDPLEKALQHLMEIHGEDIDRPLLGGHDISGGYTWDSLLFMRYGFGQIDINELVAGMETIITRNNEFINELIEPFIPLYTYLRMVLEKTNAPKDEKTQIVPFGSIPDIDDMSDDIKIKDINNYVCENDCLKILITTDTSLLEEKLKPLKEICAIYKTQKTLPV